MINAISDGGNTAGLLQYLVGRGRANEHTNPHLVAGSDVIMRRWGAWDRLSAAQGFEIAKYIDQFMNETGTRSTGSRRVVNMDKIDEKTGEPGVREVIKGPVANHVWHCSLSLSPEEAAQGDERWQQIARDFADQMGFTGADGKAPCRWVAIHHGSAKNGGDHIHIAVNIIREDGTKWSKWQDMVKASAACNRLEHKFGLEVIESREHARSARADTAADLQASARRGQDRTGRSCCPAFAPQQPRRPVSATSCCACVSSACGRVRDSRADAPTSSWATASRCTSPRGTRRSGTPAARSHAT